jgi:tRNA-Thr(GGU) m(6)t(6)A37 methyltransferase TsaA
MEFRFEPIGYVRCALRDKSETPRQPGVDGAPGQDGARIELTPTAHMRDALSDLLGFGHIWVVFVFHEAKHFRPRVQPPRSPQKRGVLATRSPHRPNPIGLSAVALLGIDDCTVHIGGTDMLDGTPVLDIKPYVAYADAHPDSAQGWLAEIGDARRDAGSREPKDPIPAYQVHVGPDAEAQLAWLGAQGLDLRPRLLSSLALGPSPHAYRRIKRMGDHWVLGLKAFRAYFRVDGMQITVLRIASGYSPRELYGDQDKKGPGASELTALPLHRAFTDLFGHGNMG